MLCVVQFGFSDLHLSFKTYNLVNPWNLDQRENIGVISENIGVISENIGVISENTGVISENNGVISENIGVISENIGVISENWLIQIVVLYKSEESYRKNLYLVKKRQYLPRVCSRSRFTGLSLVYNVLKLRCIVFVEQ